MLNFDVKRQPMRNKRCRLQLVEAIYMYIRTWVHYSGAFGIAFSLLHERLRGCPIKQIEEVYARQMGVKKWVQEREKGGRGLPAFFSPRVVDLYWLLLKVKICTSRPLMTSLVISLVIIAFRFWPLHLPHSDLQSSHVDVYILPYTNFLIQTFQSSRHYHIHLM